MKRIFIYTILLGVVFSINACKTSKQSSGATQKTDEKQVPGGIILKNGQKITVVSSSSGTSDISLGMEMKNSNSATNILSVISADDKNYNISNTLTKFSMSMSMMGQENSYDSEKPEDKENEIGKGMSSRLNAPDTLSVNRMTGNVAEDKKNSPEKDEAGENNPLAGMMEAMGSSNKNAVVEGAFFVIPKDKKIGDSWTDSISADKMKTVKTYTLKSIDNNIASVQVKGNITGNGETLMQDTEVSFTIETKSNANIIVDTKNSLVSKITTESDITLTMDMMGQSMPVTSKVNSTVTYQY